MFYCLFFAELLIGYLKTFPLEIGGGVRWVRVCTQCEGVIASIHVPMMGGRGSNFCHYGAYVLN